MCCVINSIVGLSILLNTQRLFCGGNLSFLWQVKLFYWRFSNNGNVKSISSATPGSSALSGSEYLLPSLAYLPSKPMIRKNVRMSLYSPSSVQCQQIRHYKKDAVASSHFDHMHAKVSNQMKSPYSQAWNRFLKTPHESCFQHLVILRIRERILDLFSTVSITEMVSSLYGLLIQIRSLFLHTDQTKSLETQVGVFLQSTKSLFLLEQYKGKLISRFTRTNENLEQDPKFLTFCHNSVLLFIFLH